MYSFLKLFKKNKFKIVFQTMRGYRNIKSTDNLDIIHKLKKEICQTKLRVNLLNHKKLIFFKSDNKKEELILRQFLISRLLGLDFNKNILKLSIGKKKHYLIRIT